MKNIFDSVYEFFFNEKKIEFDDMTFVYSHKYNLPLEGHVFPAVKYEQLFSLISLDEELGKIEVHYPEAIGREDLELVHKKSYIEDLFLLKSTPEIQKSELPLNSSILEAFLYGVGGTVLATELTNQHQFVFNIGGGYHHSYSDHAEGFCYLNDVAVAATLHLKKFPENKILIIDLDVHQGNGNSKIFQKEPRVYTFSMHQENLYPIKEKSNFDVGLQIGCGDMEYLNILDESLEKIYTDFQPTLIYYIAGADPYEDDRLGSLKLTVNGLMKRDRKIKEFARKVNSKVVIVTAGGYANNTMDTVQIHLNTAKEFYRK